MVSAGLMVLMVPTTAHGAKTFSDVSPQFLEEVEYLAGRGIVKGYSNGQFGASGKVTRAQAVGMIMREGRVMPVKTLDPGFTDMSGTSSFYKEVSEAVRLGIIQGKVAKDGSKYFDPNGSLTRSEMAIILTRAYQIPTDRRNIGFKDVPDSLSSKAQINAITLGGATLGYGDGTFRPFEKITREHFSVFLARLLEKRFNPMGHQFIPDDEFDLNRPPVKWYTKEEIAVQENELISLVNTLRKEAGVPPLQVNEQLSHLTNIKARGFSEYPDTRHAFTMIDEFYQVEYGIKPTGTFTEVVASGDATSALNYAMGTPEYKNALLSRANEKIGAGLAQDIDGQSHWVLFVWDDK